MLALDFIHGLRLADIPESAIHQARRCLMDLVGVAASGRNTAYSRIAHEFALRQLGTSQTGARLMFDGRRASAAGAAFAGASTLDSFDAHDGHALTKGHAGVAVLPAILALADAENLFNTQGLLADELLTLTVIGYEIATRAGIALHATASDYHTSGAWNALACAAIGARLLRLDRMQTRHAIGIAEYHGPRSQMMRCIAHPTMLKDGSGWGAFAGVSAAYLAQSGFTGAPALTLEAEDVKSLWDDLGTRWRIEEQYFKPYPVCRWAQPSIEAAEMLLTKMPIKPDEIESVDVETFAHAVSLGTAHPASTEEAQYALGFPLAVYLVRRSIGAKDIEAEGLADPAVAAMLEHIVLKEDPALSAQFPAIRLARIRIRTKSGSVYLSETTAARGDPDHPLTDAELRTKFRGYTAHLGTERSRAIENAAFLLGGAGSSAHLFADLVLEG